MHHIKRVADDSQVQVVSHRHLKIFRIIKCIRFGILTIIIIRIGVIVSRRVIAIGRVRIKIGSTKLIDEFNFVFGNFINGDGVCSTTVVVVAIEIGTGWARGGCISIVAVGR